MQISSVKLVEDRRVLLRRNWQAFILQMHWKVTCFNLSHTDVYLSRVPDLKLSLIDECGSKSLDLFIASPVCRFLSPYNDLFASLHCSLIFPSVFLCGFPFQVLQSVWYLKKNYLLLFLLLLFFCSSRTGHITLFGSNMVCWHIQYLLCKKSWVPPHFFIFCFQRSKFSCIFFSWGIVLQPSCIPRQKKNPC